MSDKKELRVYQISHWRVVYTHYLRDRMRMRVFFSINLVIAQAEESLKRLYGAEYCSQQETLLIREEQH
jgi:hypothetical protein